MRRNRTQWFCMAFLAMAFQNSAAQDQPKNVTKINLKTYGWEPGPRWERFRNPNQLMAVDHKGRVLVGYTSHARVAAEGHVLSFHILRFAPDGALELSLALPTARPHDNGLYLDAEDHLLVRANDQLQILIENDESPDKKQHWELLLPCAKKCRLLQSPTRRRLLVDDTANNPQLTFVDTSSSRAEVTQRCAAVPEYQTASFSDQSAYAIAQPPSSRVLFRWPLCNYQHVLNLLWSGIGTVRVLNDESIAIFEPNAVRVDSSNGKPKFEWTMDKRESWLSGSDISVCENGDRFASAIERHGSPWVPSNDLVGPLLEIRIAVYDSKNGTQILSMPAANPHVHHVLEFSLSPDGHRLVLLEDGVLSISNLP